MTHPHDGSSIDLEKQLARYLAKRRVTRRYLLDRIAKGDLKTSYLATHTMTLDEGPKGYDMFKHKKDGCVRAVFRPWA